MSFLHQTIEEFLAQVDSKSATPGGGSVSALSATLGISLARMMGQVTIGRKVFRNLPNEQQEEFMQAFEDLGILKEQVTPLIDKDSEAFNAIMNAYKLPKETEQERQQRNEAIQQATIGAIEVPIQVSTLAFQALELLPPMLAYGNKNASSDVKVAALELQTAILGGFLNVEINLSGLSDNTLIEHYQSQVDTLRTNTEIKMKQFQ